MDILFAQTQCYDKIDVISHQNLHSHMYRDDDTVRNSFNTYQS